MNRRTVLSLTAAAPSYEMNEGPDLGSPFGLGHVHNQGGPKSWHFREVFYRPVMTRALSPT
jgi:hypothetical protein